MNKNLRILGFIISGLPLLAYPMVFFASFLSLAAGMESDSSWGMLEIISTTFFILSLIYPIIYVGSMVGSIVIKSSKGKDICVAIPYLSLIITVALFFVWAGLE